MDDASSGMQASPAPPAAPSGAKTDTEKLHDLGYAQELKRGMGAFSNFAVSFTIISILSGCLTLFGYGMSVGGPASAAYGWPLVGILVTFVALAMAEICSSYPTAGGLYYWAAKVAPKNGPAWSWFTGWFNFLGQVGVTAGIDFGFAAFFCAFLSIAFDVEVTKLILIGSYTGVLVLHGLMNTFGIRLVALFNDISVWWHVAGVLVIFGILFLVPDQHTSWGTIFSFKASTNPDELFPAGFINGTGFSTGFFSTTIYVFLIGMLLAQYTLTGYDASAHMTEETHDADVSGPNGIWKSVVVSVVFGYILLLGVWYAVQGSQGYDNAVAGFQAASGTVAAPAQIFLDAVGKSWTVFMLLIVLGAQFFCGMSSVTANSRMIYAFSRDGAVPGHQWWHKINKRTRTPTNSIWLAVVLAWLLVAPAYWRGSVVAYFAVTSIAVIGLYIAYVIPTFLRLRAGKSFVPGRWNLGKWSVPVGYVAVIWVVFICIILMMPQFSPGGFGISVANALNYAGIAVAIVIGFAGIYWLVSARKWFKGPVVQGELQELARGGQVDTVLCMFTDLQGRFMGKRVLPDFFLEEILGAEGLHACLYLLAIDMEMEPLPGYRYASWDTGYGDFRMIPDLTTLRWCPWIERTVLVLCDIADEETSEPVAVAPRQILRDQIAKAAAQGFQVKTGSELEFYLFKDSFDELADRSYREPRPSSPYIMDYHMLQTTKDEWFIRQVRNGMRGAGIPVEFSKGEFGKGQHEINITYSDALSNADHHAMYKHGAKEIAALNGVALTFMAKWTMAEAGSSCHLHSSVWNVDGSESLTWADGGDHHLSETFRWYLGGLMTTAREMAWMYAPFVNSYKRYQLGSWAPTAIVWSRDNRTCGFRTVGEHAGFRVECRLPGADANPYLAFAATIASGMWGIRNRIEPPEMFVGNAYEAKDVPRVPTSLHEAVETFRASTVAREAFGDFVFEHLLNTAEQEQIIFDNTCVTDWELARYFERG